MHSCLSRAGFGTRPSARTRTCTHTYMYTCMHSATYLSTPTCTHIHILPPACIPHTQFAHTVLRVMASASSSVAK